MRVIYKKGDDIIYAFDWNELTSAYVALYGLYHSGTVSDAGKPIIAAQLAKIQFHIEERQREAQLLLEDKRKPHHLCKACFRMFRDSEEYLTGTEAGYVIYYHKECPPLTERIK